MMHQVTGLLLSIAAAAVSIHVGRLFLFRSAQEAHRVGLRAFALWWFSLAGFTAVSVISKTLSLVGWNVGFVYRTLAWLSLIPLTLSLGSLVAYLLYLSTGNPRVIRWVAIGYSLVYVMFALLLGYLNPIGVELKDGAAQTLYENTMPQSIALLVVASLLAPAIFSMVAYARLFFRLDDPTSRYRIALVSVSLLVWFLSALVVSALDLSRASWWAIASPAIGLGASLLILAAYRPPRWVQRRYNIEPPPMRQRETGPALRDARDVGR